MAVVGSYQLLGRVSQQRPVPVWKGRDAAGRRDVALKQLEPTTDESLTRLRAQARVLAGISHPGIVEVIELVEDRQHAWLIETWIDGTPLSELLLAGGPVSGPEAVGVVRGVLAGLAHAHEHGIVHGNIASAQVLVDGFGRAKLTDFATSTVQAPITPRSDVAAAIALLADLSPDPPAAIAEVLRRARSVAAAERYVDADQCREDLEAAAGTSFGADWLERSDLGPRVRASPTPVQPSASLGPGGRPAPETHNGSSELSGSSESPPSPTAEEDEADLRKYLETRPNRTAKADRLAGRLITIAAAVVVVAAIAILVFNHRDKPTAATRPGLSFRGTYTVTSTSLGPGVGADAGRPAGTVLSESWQVTPSCASADRCTATVAPSVGAPFMLTYVDGGWTGARPMTADAGCSTSAPASSGVDTFALTPAATAKGGQKLVGSMLGVVGGCSSLGTEQSSLVLDRVTA